MAAVAQKTPIAVLQSAWKKIAPLELADNAWDNVGVMMEAPYPKSNARKILLTIDLTTEVCNEALEMPDCSLVLSYHPPIFSGLKSMKLSNTLQASLLKLSAKGISVFAPHTSLDAIEGGINTWLTSAFGSNVQSSRPIEPKFEPTSPAPDHLSAFSDAGMGRIVELKQAVEADEAIKSIKTLLGMKHLQYGAPPRPSKIQTIALCAGSGGSMFKNVSADLFWTGEMSHHQVLAMTQAGSHIVLCQHTNTERGFLRDVLKQRMQSEMTQADGQEWDVVVSEFDKDPLQIV